MARTESAMLALGRPAPDFQLLDTVSGQTCRYDDIAGDRATLVMFICNHCPFVQHVLDQLAQLGHDYAGPDVGLVAISSNDTTTYPQDSPEKMRELAQDAGFNFPYLFDESQQVARDFGAVCTPDFFVFDGDRRLAYRGQLDDARPGNDTPVTGKDLRAALDALVAGQPVSTDQKPSVGCNIKWKPA